MASCRTFFSSSARSMIVSLTLIALPRQGSTVEQFRRPDVGLHWWVIRPQGSKCVHEDRTDGGLKGWGA
jgi:hypothetical protein